MNEYLGDTILDLELTPNRLDCLSMVGVAHEVAALTGGRVTEPAVHYETAGAPIDQRVSISIADPDLCRRYTASLIEGVRVGPSPGWLQDRLARAGLRPINNVVDVTNFVMLEYNQPLHAFDMDSVKDATVIVRRAKLGETLTTLDGVERRLAASNLVIADSRDPIGLGGVIGGANSEIEEGTTAVLLESATFDGPNNRATAGSLELRTEATLRFEKGLRTELAPIALRRATALIQQVAGGTIAPGIIDVFPEADAPALTVPLTAARLRQVLGMEFDFDTVKGVLDSLGFPWESDGSDGSDGLAVTVPYWRNDVSIEEDLVEEVIRIAGYETVPTAMLSTPIPFQTPSPGPALREQVKDLLSAVGMQEVINYPLVALPELERVGELDPQQLPMAVANPMSASHQYLRPTLHASILGTLAANQGHGAGPFRFFEAGRVFLPRSADLPEEVEMVTGVLAGRREETSWLTGGDSFDFFDAKGVVDSVLQRLGVLPVYEQATNALFHPGRCAVIKAGEIKVGFVGEVHWDIRGRFGLEGTVAAFELDLARLLAVIPESDRQFTALSRYPAATRDLALVVPNDVPGGRVNDIIRRHRLVERAELFDVYAGDNLPEGFKSLAFHVYFRAADRTLTNEEVNRSLDGLLRMLEREANASLRG